jgi:DNA-binding NtrC family response regulator
VGEKPHSSWALERLIGKSSAIKKIREQVQTAGLYDYPVLIQGETGVGKTLVALIIHALSRRSERPFLHIGCSNIHPDLMESELFGHERGAFTGAVMRKRGKIELANGGTVFLDEVADLSPQSQAKLLLFLEGGRFYRVGGTEELSSDIRLITASNRNLMEQIKGKRFRGDLYYRIDIIEINIPPLRERKEDIPVLAEEILKNENQQKGTSDRITPPVMAKLEGYDYPGNVRELENVIKRAIVNSKGEEINPRDFVFSSLELFGKTNKIITPQKLKTTLTRCRGNKSSAAKELGISRTWMYKLLKK